MVSQGQPSISSLSIAIFNTGISQSLVLCKDYQHFSKSHDDSPRGAALSLGLYLRFDGRDAVDEHDDADAFKSISHSSIKAASPLQLPDCRTGVACDKTIEHAESLADFVAFIRRPNALYTNEIDRLSAMISFINKEQEFVSMIA